MPCRGELLTVQVPAGGWTQILLYMGWCEVSRGPGSDIASGRPGRVGGYCSSDVFFGGSEQQALSWTETAADHTATGG